MSEGPILKPVTMAYCRYGNKQCEHFGAQVPWCGKQDQPINVYFAESIVDAPHWCPYLTPLPELCPTDAQPS